MSVEYSSSLSSSLCSSPDAESSQSFKLSGLLWSDCVMMYQHAVSQTAWEFQQNGREVELDSVDKLQVEKRSSNLSTVLSSMFHQPKPLSRAVIHRDEQRILQDTIGGPRRSRKVCCVFCKKNKETPAIYKSHRVMDEYGNVTCPVLRQFSCPLCGATDDKAHTIKYCPITSEMPHDKVMKARMTTELGNRRRHSKVTGKSNPRCQSIAA